jgi:hypothetical protein
LRSLATVTAGDRRARKTMRRSRPDVDPRKLTARQQFLLSAIPAHYDLERTVSVPEPADIKHARRIVLAFDKKLRAANCRRAKEVATAINKAREAVYFCSEQTALAMIHRLTRFQKKCEGGDE